MRFLRTVILAFAKFAIRAAAAINDAHEIQESAHLVSRAF